MDILTIKEAASLLHVHPDTLSAMAKRKEIPCAKPGKCYIFLKEDLIEWVRSKYKEQPPCHSPSEAVSIGLTCATKESVSEKLQALRTKKRRSGSTTS